MLVYQLSKLHELFLLHIDIIHESLYFYTSFSVKILHVGELLLASKTAHFNYSIYVHVVHNLGY